LEADNPILMAFASQPIAPHVTYHSIIANIHPRTTPKNITDGVVNYHSAHIAGAASECLVTASHLCEADPEVINEVHRILCAHLAEH
jgi:hypothetical protein